MNPQQAKAKKGDHEQQVKMSEPSHVARGGKFRARLALPRYDGPMATRDPRAATKPDTHENGKTFKKQRCKRQRADEADDNSPSSSAPPLAKRSKQKAPIRGVSLKSMNSPVAISESLISPKEKHSSLAKIPSDSALDMAKGPAMKSSSQRAPGLQPMQGAVSEPRATVHSTISKDHTKERYEREAALLAELGRRLFVKGSPGSCTARGEKGKEDLGAEVQRLREEIHKELFRRASIKNEREEIDKYLQERLCEELLKLGLDESTITAIMKIGQDACSHIRESES